MALPKLNASVVLQGTVVAVFGEHLPEENQFATVRLRDGRKMDVSPRCFQVVSDAPAVVEQAMTAPEENKQVRRPRETKA